MSRATGCASWSSRGRRSAELAPQVAAFNAACPNGGSWCSISDLAFFRLPECLAATPALGDVVAELTALQAYGGDQGGWSGAALIRAEALDQTFLGAAGDAGAGLLGALDGWAGSADAELWYAESEVPCHNCHAWQTLLVVYYPEVGRAFAILATTGWDS